MNVILEIPQIWLACHEEIELNDGWSFQAQEIFRKYSRHSRTRVRLGWVYLLAGIVAVSAGMDLRDRLCRFDSLHIATVTIEACHIWQGNPVILLKLWRKYG